MSNIKAVFLWNTHLQQMQIPLQAITEKWVAVFLNSPCVVYPMTVEFQGNKKKLLYAVTLQTMSRQTDRQAGYLYVSCIKTFLFVSVYYFYYYSFNLA